MASPLCEAEQAPERYFWLCPVPCLKEIFLMFMSSLWMGVWCPCCEANGVCVACRWEGEGPGCFALCRLLLT